MKVLRLIILILVFSLCLFAGFKLGSKFNLNDEEIVFPANTPSIIEPLGGENQQNILIIGVDQLNSSLTQIEGLWLLIYYRDTPQIDLIPIFPSIREEDILKNQALAGNFSISQNGEPNQSFWQYLQSRDILWHNNVLLDEIALYAITDLVGLSRSSNDGQMISWVQDTTAALKSQSLLLSEVCQSFGSSNVPGEITNIVASLTPHLTSDLSFDQITSEWRLLLTYGNQLNCKFPTLTP